ARRLPLHDFSDRAPPAALAGGRQCDQGGRGMIHAPPMPACRIVTDPADLERLRPAWTALLEASASNEPTLSPDWLLTWWGVFGLSQGRRLCCICIEEDGRLIGLAPLLSRLSWYRRFVPFRRLEPLAAG